MHLGSNVSSIESYFNFCIAKVTATIDSLSIIWISDLSDKIKRDFFQGAVIIETTVRMHHMDANKTHDWELHKNAMSCIEQILKATPHEKRPHPYCL